MPCCLHQSLLRWKLVRVPDSKAQELEGTNTGMKANSRDVCDQDFFISLKKVTQV